MQTRANEKNIQQCPGRQSLRSTSWTMNVMLATILFTIVSCTDSSGKKRGDDGNNGNQGNVAKKPCLTLESILPSTLTEATEISWDVEIKPIFVKNCGTCHPGSQRTNYATYEGVKKGIIEIRRNIEANKMPKQSPLSAADQKLINKWITAGMPEKVSSSSPKPDSKSDPDCDNGGNDSTSSTTGSATTSTTGSATTSTTGSATTSPSTSYAGAVKPMIDQYCISCHGSTGNDPKLDTLAKVKANFSAIRNAMKNGTMPQDGAVVSSATQATFASWGTAPNGTIGQWAP
jgi:mono/diheme cytochrome c family protein